MNEGKQRTALDNAVTWNYHLFWGKQRTALDNAVTWNYHLFCHKVCPFEARHKSYNHRVLSFAALVEDFITTFKASKQFQHSY